MQWTAGGGGKYTQNVVVSTLRITLSGSGMGDASTFTTSTAIAGSVQAFNYGTRTLIQSVFFSSLQGRLLGGGDMALVANAIANVNGVATNVQFSASQTGGLVTFQILDANTGEVLAGGTGEAGRSALGLTITP